MSVSLESKSVVFMVCVFLVLFLFVTIDSAGRSKDMDLLGVKAIIEGNNLFCFDLYRELAKEKGNVFFSPTGISTGLAMIYGGANGHTEKEMAQVLHFTLPQEKLHGEFKNLASLLEGIRDGQSIEFDMANSLWLQKDSRMNKEFLKICKTFYKSVPFSVNFAIDSDREKARTSMNRWVAENTKERIAGHIPQELLTRDTLFILLDSVYVKGDWAYEFNPAHTRDASFYVSPGEEAPIPLMVQKGLFNCMENDAVQVLEMPYKGKTLSMLCLLPREKTGIKKLETELDNRLLNNWIAQLKPADIAVLFPKLKITCKYMLKDSLSSLGMGSAFSPSANFSGMSLKGGIYLTEVVHQAFLEITEEGAEAAAATAVSGKKGGKVFMANHPFIFLIRDQRNGNILFMGRVSNPSS